MLELKSENENKAKVLIIGDFTSGDISLSVGRKMPENPMLRQQSEDRWDQKWFAGPLVRLESFGLRAGILTLAVAATDFKEYVGSRDLDSLRRYGVGSLSNPISTSTIVISADNKIVVADKTSGDAIGSIDAPGGYIHPVRDVDPKTGQLDVFRAALREVGEEVFFGKQEISDEQLQEAEQLIIEKICLGLSYEYAGLCHPVLSFAMRTNLTSEQLIKRAAAVGQMPDHEIKVRVIDPEKVPDDPDADYIIKLLSQRYPNVEPDGRITIALARKWLAGIVYPKRQLREFNQV